MPSRSTEEETILQGKMFAVLAYLSALCILPLLFRKDNPFALSHGKQGLVIFIAEVAVFILQIAIPFIFKPAIFFLGALSLWGIIESLRGRYVKLPFVADIAEKISL